MKIHKKENKEENEDKAIDPGQLAVGDFVGDPTAIGQLAIGKFISLIKTNPNIIIS